MESSDTTTNVLMVLKIRNYKRIDKALEQDNIKNIAFCQGDGKIMGWDTA